MGPPQPEDYGEESRVRDAKRARKEDAKSKKEYEKRAKKVEKQTRKWKKGK